MADTLYKVLDKQGHVIHGGNGRWHLPQPGPQPGTQPGPQPGTQPRPQLGPQPLRPWLRPKLSKGIVFPST